jgi:hypothetical protein
MFITFDCSYGSISITYKGPMEDVMRMRNTILGNDDFYEFRELWMTVYHDKYKSTLSYLLRDYDTLESIKLEMWTRGKLKVKVDGSKEQLMLVSKFLSPYSIDLIINGDCILDGIDFNVKGFILEKRVYVPALERLANQYFPGLPIPYLKICFDDAFYSPILHRVVHAKIGGDIKPYLPFLENMAYLDGIVFDPVPSIKLPNVKTWKCGYIFYGEIDMFPNLKHIIFDFDDEGDFYAIYNHGVRLMETGYISDNVDLNGLRLLCPELVLIVDGVYKLGKQTMSLLEVIEPQIGIRPHR